MGPGEDLEQIVDLADGLAADAAALRARWQRLAAELEADLAAERPTTPGPDPVLPAVTANTAEEEMLLVAIDMVLSGAARDDVVAHLQKAFGRDQVGPIVDRVVADFAT